MKRAYWPVVAILILALVAVEGAHAEKQAFGRITRTSTVGPGGVVQLPYYVPDNKGYQWRIYQGGWVQQQGNQPLYGQGAQLIINGNGINQNNNQGKVDEKTGELILENLNVANLVITRRVLIDKEQSLVRYIDIIKNPGNQPVQAQIQIQSNFNYGINASTTVPDPKRKGQEVAWIAQTGAGASVMEIFSGKGAKTAFAINGPPQNSYVQATMSQQIPAGKEIAIMHLHGIVPTTEAGVQFAKNLRESLYMRNIPREVRKIIVNFTGGQNYIGDVEILRGELLDIVEVKGGDQYRGTLREQNFSLQTFYGKVELPVNQVIGLINVGRYRPRQLLITVDGQIFGGKLEKDTVDLELSSKQLIKVPLSQVLRVGYRKRDGEPEEWTFDKPIVLMRSGERVGVRMPAEPLTVVTRYGKLQIKPETVAALLLQTEEHGVHEVLLTDGSRFAGLIDATNFTMKLDNAAGQAVTFPASSVSRMIFNNKGGDVDDATGTLALTNDDTLVGALEGKLAVDTVFDTIAVNAGEIKSLTHPTPGSLDVTVTLWDGTTLSGQLQDQELSCKLASGLAVKVPVALLQEYQQSQPAASGALIERIKSIVAELNDDDWKKRDRAGAALISMGPIAIGALKDLRGSQPPEAQQRIDSIIKDLEKQRDAPGGIKPATTPKPGGPVPPTVEPAIELEVDR